MNPEYTEEYTDIHDKTIHLIRTGNGNHLTHFLHANGMCAKSYLPFFDLLKNDLSIIASDIRGQGDSSGVNWLTTKDWLPFADDLCSLLIAKTSAPVCGIGHSIGSAITLLAASRKPELFSSIILIDPVLLSPYEIMKRKFLRFINQEHILALPKGARKRTGTFESMESVINKFRGRGMFRTWKDEFTESWCEHSVHEKSDGTAELKCTPENEARMYEIDSVWIWRYVKKITCPCLIIRGKDSFVLTEKMAERFVKITPQTKLVQIDSGHFVPQEKPEECALAIREFVSSTLPN